ncbi:YihY/virulence factor BrkB family protein [uncultured Enterococcus sp.]|uniref:YihY/virulence factor BrkB family protein n=1 Tax=uncultured Enterococcus sp. TaxID=167972 RepID=UPI0025DFEE46|nr:YihY/virulence factor BrkB family protein [uncultured Enterococcus sp.]
MTRVKKILQNEKLTHFLDILKTRLTDAEIGNSAVVVTYYLLLSIFPLLIAIGNVLPLLQIDPNKILPYMQELIPEQIYQFLGPVIKELLTQGSGKLLSISALGALWSASKSINALQTAMNKAYGVEERANFFVVRAVSLVVIIFFMISIVGVFIVFGVGKLILDVLQPILQFPNEWVSIFQTIRWPLTMIVLIAMMTMIYWLVPNGRVKLRSALPGAVLTSIGWIVLSQVFGIYATYFARRVSGYQIIGSFIVLMIWLNFISMIIILGGILNAVIEEMVSGREVQQGKDRINRLSRKIKRKVKKESGSD